MDIEQEGNEVDPQVEHDAREMGWKPLEEFKGDPDKWVEADVFVERGEHIMPILKANNNRLKSDLLTRDKQIDTLKQELQVTKSIVQGLEKNFSESLQKQLAEQRKELRTQLIEARKDGDAEAELDIEDQLDQLTVAEKAAKDKQAENKEKLKTPVDKDPQPELSPDFRSWHNENTWFGGESKEDRQRTKAIKRIAEDLRDDGDTTTGREFMDKCMDILLEQETGRGTPTSKVENGNSRTSSRSSGKGFASLPSEARRACQEDAENFVGEGKLFKTEKEWQDYYTKTYYGDQL